MNEWLALIFNGIAGLLLGAIFFGGLWWTVRKGMLSPQPALWFLGSLVVRTALVLAGFHFASGGHWQRLLVCLFGFFVARFGVVWMTKVPIEKKVSLELGAQRAPES